jgi:signal transduction histidine kinase
VIFEHLQRLAHIGVTDELPDRESRRVIFLNCLIVAIVPLIALYAFVASAYLPASWPVLLVAVFNVFGIATTLLWMHRRRYLASRVWFCGVATVFSLLIAALVGAESRFHLFLIVCIFLMFYKFPANQRNWMYGFISLYCVGILAVEFLFRDGGLIADLPPGFITATYYFDTVGLLYCAVGVGGLGYFALSNAEERLARTVKDLEIASAHKSLFVANMSHELRTPLAAILGYAELMEEGIYEPLGQQSLAALGRIRSNGKHLLGLINTVLDIAKIESGQFSLNMAEYAMAGVVETVRSATESLAQNKKLALTTEVAKSLPIGLGDEQRLTQVLLNLVGNAIKFTETGEVRVTADAADGRFAVSVADTGPGIPEHERTRIFEQFHQVNDSNTKAKGGTGLGLAITKQIVEMHGGRIWVDSTVGKGSTFRVELPIRAGG